MSTIRNTVKMIATAGLLSAAWLASASDDTQATSTAQPVQSTGGAYSINATDRGGKESENSTITFEFTMFDWLRGLMD